MMVTPTEDSVRLVYASCSSPLLERPHRPLLMVYSSLCCSLRDDVPVRLSGRLFSFYLGLILLILCMFYARLGISPLFPCIHCLNSCFSRRDGYLRFYCGISNDRGI